jgi:nucleotide-binding universal stress UspA family protein
MTTATATNSAPRRGVILVSLALDGTSDWALLEGARLARERNDSELHVVHAVQMPDESLGAFDRRLTDAPVEIQRRIEALWVNGEPLQVIAHLGSGEPARLILQTAADLEADVIVVGSHQRSGLQKLVLGSVAEQVLRGARCSVMVALPHDYTGADKPKHVDPPCVTCLEARKRSEGASYWCTRHAKDYVTPHIYRPRNSVSAATRNSIPGML